MIRNQLIRILTCLALICLCACSPKTEYTHALPKNASLLMGIDVPSIIQKAGLQGDGGQSVTNKLSEFIQGGLEGEARQMASLIIENPQESGLSFTDKVYLFATPHANAIGIVAKVSHTGKLEKLFKALHKEGLCTPLEKEIGCQWTLLGDVVCAFNNGTFLLMYNTLGEADNIKGTAFTLMRQEAGEGYTRHEDFVQITEKGNDLASIIDISILPDDFTTPLRIGLPGDIRLQDIKYLITANFENGRIEIEAKSETENPTLVKFYQLLDSITRIIEGKLMDNYRGNTTLWMGANIQGKDFFELLCKNQVLRQNLENPILPIDLQRIISSIDGEIAFGLASFISGEWMAYAQVNDDDILETFEDLRPLLELTGGQISLHDTGEKQYAMSTLYGNYWFGVKDNLLYITNRPEPAEEVGREYGVSVENQPWSADAKQSRWFAGVNFKTFAEDCRRYPYALRNRIGEAPAAIWKSIIDACQSGQINVKEWEEGKIIITTNDKKTNVLQQITKGIENL